MKKTIKTTALIVLLISIIFLIRFFYILHTYKKVHESRKDLSYLESIHNNSLSAIENYVFSNDLFTSNQANKQEVTIDLSEIDKTSTLLKEGFYDVLVSRDSQNKILIELEKTYMMYEKIPTYHTISYFPDGYEISNTSRKKMNNVKNWYLSSFDDKEVENEVEFLDILVLLRYDEAIEFQKKKRRNKKNYVLRTKNFRSNPVEIVH